MPYALARFARGGRYNYLNTLFSFAAPSRQSTKTLLTPLRSLATNNIHFAHDIAQAANKEIDGLRMHFKLRAIPQAATIAIQ